MFKNFVEFQMHIPFPHLIQSSPTTNINSSLIPSALWLPVSAFSPTYRL